MNIYPIGTVFNKINIFKNTFSHENIRYNYTLNTDTVSFTGRRKVSFKTEIEQMPQDSFPSSDYREYLINELSKPDNKQDLIDIHQKYYSGLLDCKTLDEAKERYPEFENVVDAKDIDLSLLSPRSILSRISKGTYKKAPELTSDVISLELLKKYYAQILPVTYKENYWGAASNAILPLLDLLNMKMSPEYSKIIESAKRTKGAKK